MSKRFIVFQRDIVLVPFPFSTLSTAKFRPAIVVSNDVYNKKSSDFIAIPLTSNLNIRDHVVQINNKQMSSGSLPLPSVAKVDRIFSLEQSLVRRKFGQIRQDAFDDVKKELFKLVS